MCRICWAPMDRFGYRSGLFSCANRHAAGADLRTISKLPIVALRSHFIAAPRALFRGRRGE
jgi:hypothetical protein